MFLGNLKIYGVIYKITNIKNNKVYIGQTTYGFNRRYKNNLLNYTQNDHLKYSIHKYGIENFEISKIFDIAFSKEELNIKECIWINYFKSTNSNFGYNKTLGGSTTKLTKESREKMSNSQKLKWKNKSFRSRVIPKIRKVTQSDSYRKNMSNSLKNSEAHKKACSSKEFKNKQSISKTKLWENKLFREQIISSVNNSWTENRKSEHSKMMKNRYKDDLYLNKISKSFKNRWEDQEQRTKLCNSMKKIFLMINIETGECMEFLGRSSLANHIGKSESYVKKYMSKKIKHNEKFIFVRKDNYQEAI